MNRLRQISELVMVVLFFLVPVSMQAQFTTPLPGSSGNIQTSLGQGTVVTAAGQITSTIANQPGAVANFGLTEGGFLTTEAGVAASAPTTAARFFVDYSTANNTDSGVAVANPSGTTITLNVQLNNSQGIATPCPSQTVPANGHLAIFASQLCQGAISNPFLGTLTLTSSTAFAATNLMSGINSHGEPLFNSLPVATPNAPPSGTHLYFSQFADGGGFSTEILLMNLTGTAISGTVAFSDNPGNPVTLNFGSPLGSTSTLNYAIPANGMQKFTSTGSKPGVALQSGAVIVTSATGALPSGAVVFSYYNGTGGLESQAGVLNSPLTTFARLYVEKTNTPLSRDTGVALVNPNSSSATVTVNLTSLDSSFTASNIINVPANNHLAVFVDQSALLGAAAASIPSNFQGVLTLSSDQTIASVSLRITTNQRGDLLFSTLPVVDLNHPPTGPLYLPQIADGGGFTTQIILVNSGSSAGNITVDFHNDSGSAVQIPLLNSSGVPSVYQDLYSQLTQDLNDFNQAVTATWDGSAFPVTYSGELSSANVNIGPKLLTSDSMASIQQELLVLKALGVKAVAVEVSFPMLYRPFFDNFVGSDSQYLQWVSFYTNLAATIRAQGMKIIVESETLIPTATANGGNPPAWAQYLTGPNGFYASLNWTQYQAARAATVTTVAQTIQPDYFLMQTEPDTESNQTGQADIITPAGSVSLTNQTVAAAKTAGVPGMKVGVGIGSWLVQYLSYVNGYTQTNCSSSQPCVTAKPDYFDVHIFPVNETAPLLGATNTNFWQNALSIVTACKAANMPVTITQTWLRKIRDSEWGPGKPGALPGDYQEARETYSFWQPLDELHLQTLSKLANYGHMLYVVPFNTQNWNAYLTWGNSTALIKEGGSSTTGSVFSAVFGQASQNVQQAIYTGTALAYHQIIFPDPIATDKTPPSTPAHLTATLTSPTSLNLNWNASTDNVGVAGYHIWRNGTPLSDVFPTSSQDSALASRTTYTYQVEAFDLAGNVSPAASVSITTP